MTYLVIREEPCAWCKGAGHLDDPVQRLCNKPISISPHVTFGPPVRTQDGHYVCSACEGVGYVRTEEPLLTALTDTDLFRRLDAIESALAEREGDHR